jgi:hypothetical protein
MTVKLIMRFISPHHCQPSLPDLLVAPACTLWQAWDSSLADHIRFNEENAARHLAMFETSSNAGAWCYFMMHTLYALCVLALSEVRPVLERIPLYTSLTRSQRLKRTN